MTPCGAVLEEIVGDDRRSTLWRCNRPAGHDSDHVVYEEDRRGVRVARRWPASP